MQHFFERNLFRIVHKVFQNWIDFYESSFQRFNAKDTVVIGDISKNGIVVFLIMKTERKEINKNQSENSSELWAWPTERDAFHSFFSKIFTFNLFAFQPLKHENLFYCSFPIRYPKIVAYRNLFQNWLFTNQQFQWFDISGEEATKVSNMKTTLLKLYSFVLPVPNRNS